MLALVVSIGLALSQPQQSKPPTTKEIIAFLTEAKKQAPKPDFKFELPKEMLAEMQKEADFDKVIGPIIDSHPKDSPEVIASRWLNLLDSTLVGPRDKSVGPGRVLSAIPHPDAWPAIAKGLRKNFGSRTSSLAASLVLYAEILDGTPQSQSSALATLKKRYTKSGKPASDIKSFEMFMEPEKPEVKQKETLATLARNAKDPNKTLQLTSTHWELVKSNHEAFFKKLFIESKATIVMAYLSPAQTIQVVKWFKETASQHLIAQWGMVDTFDSHGLYQLIAKRFNPFPKANNGDDGQPFENYTGVSARNSYLLGLAARGEVAKAVAGAGDGSSLEFDSTDQFDESLSAAAKKNILQYLSQVAKKSPVSPAWDGLRRFSFLVNDFTIYTETARTALANPKLNPTDKVRVRYQLGEALLASDKVDEALPHLQVASSASNEARWKLRTLAVLLNKPELKPKAARQEQDGAASRNPNNEKLYQLVVAGKFEEAKKVLNGDPLGSFLPDSIMGDVLKEAVDARDIESMMDIIELYEWDMPPSDLSTSQEEPNESPNPFSTARLPRSKPSMFLTITTGLTKRGMGKEAGMFARKILYHNPVDDDAYMALITAEGDAAIPLLDSMAAADPYEERPLIWKAKRLQMSARLAEAEETVKAAIKIDPSDGETGDGRRMVVYSVYADILEAQGKKEDANLYRNAVAAIRKSEIADMFLEVGIPSRAIRLYQESLDQFADAYCIQTRLAAQLASIGKRAEALEHYKKSYELMSSSFGYVETHCFGCEGVFEGEDQQRLAEDVFQEQLKKSPEVPQNHYLMGYLRASQGKRVEAAAYFREALRLAPTYANAAKELLETEVPMSAEERARLVKLASNAEESGRNRRYVDDEDLRTLYLRTMAKMEQFGITNDEPMAIPYKVKPLAAEFANLAVPRGMLTGGPAGAVQSSSLMLPCIILVDSLYDEVNPRTRDNGPFGG